MHLTSAQKSLFQNLFSDWVKQYSEAEKKDFEDAKAITDDIWKNIEAQRSTAVRPDNSVYTGTYSDSWFGEVSISEMNGKLWFDSKRSYDLTGEMFWFRGNTFIVKWNDRSLDADAYVMFCLDNTGKASGMTMEAISPLTDFSYDFHDLEFHR